MDITSFDGEYRFLSNFYPCGVLLDGQLYPSVEHAYQAAKFDLPLRGPFQHLRTAGQAKCFAKGMPAERRPDWDLVKVGIMHTLLVQKFSRHDLRAKLLATDPFHLEEGNTWNDTFWGTCNGKGKNHLGLLLMKIRDYLKDQPQ